MASSHIGKSKIILITAAAAVVVIIAAVILLLVFGGGGEGYSSISVKEIVGDVTVEHKGDVYKAYPNMHLTDGFTMTTAVESYSRMNLDDAKFVKLEEQSRAKFEAIGSGGKSTSIKLEYGEMSSEISRPLNAGEGYTITTPNAVLSVRGTLFITRARKDTDGKWVTDVYTFGGSVSSHRIMPDGTPVNEDVHIDAGFKATIKMDDETTYYIEEVDTEIGDNVDPLSIHDIEEDILVDVYAAAISGHSVCFTVEELEKEFDERGVDLSKYTSYRTGETLGKNNNSGNDNESTSDTEGDVTTAPEEDNNNNNTSAPEPGNTSAPGELGGEGGEGDPGSGGEIDPGDGGESNTSEPGSDGGEPPASGGGDDTTQPPVTSTPADPGTPEPPAEDEPGTTTSANEPADNVTTPGNDSDPDGDQGGDDDDDTTEPPDVTTAPSGEENPDSGTSEPSETTKPENEAEPGTTTSKNYTIPTVITSSGGSSGSGGSGGSGSELTCPYCNKTTSAWTVEISEGDCIHNGIKHLICPNCNKIVEDITIPAPGSHYYGVGETIQSRWTDATTTVGTHALSLTVKQACLNCSEEATVVSGVICYPDSDGVISYTFTGLDGGTHYASTSASSWWTTTCDHIYGLSGITYLGGQFSDARFNGTLVCSNCSDSVTVSGTVTDFGTMADGSTKYFIDFVYNGETWSDTYTVPATCTHDYNYEEMHSPTFTWSSDHTSCTARFYCLNGCGAYTDVTCSIDITDIGSGKNYTAWCEFNDFTYSDTYSTCTHDFNFDASYTPSFGWNSDYTECTAYFFCQLGCGTTEEVTCSIETEDLGTSIQHKATCTFSGNTYTDYQYEIKP